jgi:chitin synthase
MIFVLVMVGVMIQVTQDGMTAPSSLFFIMVTMQIIVTGLLHPQEIKALPAGIIYYITSEFEDFD